VQTDIGQLSRTVIVIVMLLTEPYPPPLIRKCAATGSGVLEVSIVIESYTTAFGTRVDCYQLTRRMIKDIKTR